MSDSPSAPEVKAKPPAGLAIPNHFWLRSVIFLICIPSGAAVLTEVYGLIPLGDVVWFAAVPSYIILFLLWALLRNGPRAEISDAIAIGAVGGFLGVIAYDVARIPFLLSGYRIFATNSSYGLWILDAAFATRFTEVSGWLYHFSNGTLFGIMYAIFMRGRHWGWSIAWAFLLETIALVSPYGRIYNITQSPLLTIVAYYGHVAYALPLGLMVQRWAASAGWLRNVPMVYKVTAAVVVAAAIVGPLISPDRIAVDSAARPGLFEVQGSRLVPAWQHRPNPGPVMIRNSCDRDVVILLNAQPVLKIARCENVALNVPAPGIYRLSLPAEGLRTRSSFILVDPVAKAP